MTDPTNDSKILALFAYLEQGNTLDTIQEGYFSRHMCQDLADRFNVPENLLWRCFIRFYEGSR